jgi:hypothetical protein
MGTLAVGLALVCLFTMQSHSERAELERFEEVTAAGDKDYVQAPKRLDDPPPVLAHLNGKPLVLISAEKVKIHDTAMLRTGRDEAAGVFIYAAREPAAGEEGFFYLKIDTGEYLKTRIREALAPE